MNLSDFNDLKREKKNTLIFINNIKKNNTIEPEVNIRTNISWYISQKNASINDKSKGKDILVSSKKEIIVYTNKGPGISQRSRTGIQCIFKLNKQNYI